MNTIPASVEQIARALGQAIPTSGGYKCLCPSHNDTTPSLVIYHRGPDGRPFAKCMTCGSPEGIYKAIEEKTGMHFAGREMKNTEPSETDKEAKKTAVNAIYPAPIEWRPVQMNGQAPTRHWEYTDSTGKLLFVVARWDTFQGKVIRPFSVVNANGNLIWKSVLQLEQRPPYNLKQLTDNPKLPVLVVEGEKAAEAARYIPEFAEHVVTTYQSGAKSWRRTDWQALKGRDIVLWPDNDQEGLRNFIELGQWFNTAGFAKSVLMANVPKHWPLKWDLADELPEGARIDDVQFYKAPMPDRRSTLKTITPANYREALDSLYFLMHDGTQTYTVSKEYLEFRKGALVTQNENYASMTINNHHEAYDVCLVGKRPVLQVWYKDKLVEGDHVKGVRFYPGTSEQVVEEHGTRYVNGFTGWMYEPSLTGSCEKFKGYILETLCDNDKKAFEYIWNFLSHIIQYPQEKPNVALLFKGKKGTGKSFFFAMIQELLGGLDGYGYMVNSSATFAGSYNGPYAIGRLAMFVNEWEITKSRTIENLVKSFITENKVEVNIKYIKNFSASNYTRVMGATNHNHVWNTSEDERRISVFEVSESHRLDNKYFEEIADELKNGGFQRLMYELQNYACIRYQVMVPFENEALNVQKDMSKTPAQELAFEMLSRGEVFLRLLDDKNEQVGFYTKPQEEWELGEINLPSALVNSVIGARLDKKRGYETAYHTKNKEASCSGVIEWLGGDTNNRTSVTVNWRGIQKKFAGYKIPDLNTARMAYAKRAGLPYTDLFEQTAEIVALPNARTVKTAKDDVPF